MDGVGIEQGGSQVKKKEILIVAHHLTVGGVQKSLLSALKAIDYEKYKVTLYLRKNRLDLLSLVDENVEVIVNDDKNHYYRKPFSIILQLGIFMCKVLKQNKWVEILEKRLADSIRTAMMRYEARKYFCDKTYDIAISYVQGYTTEFVANYVNANKKYVFYQVSTDEVHEIHEKAFPHYSKILVEHEDIKALLSEWYPSERDKIEIVENYVDYDVIQKQSEEFEVEKDAQKIAICSCGRFAKVKGFDLGVEAANVLKNRGKEFIWYMVGDGPEREKMETLIHKYELDNYIKLTGMQKNPYPYIAKADIFVQPSYEEALSIALLEAQMLCVPIVSTKTVGGITMIRDRIDGILVDINVEAMANGIEELLDDEKMRESLKNELKKIDYIESRKKYQNRWNELLGE